MFRNINAIKLGRPVHRMESCEEHAIFPRGLSIRACSLDSGEGAQSFDEAVQNLVRVQNEQKTMQEKTQGLEREGAVEIRCAPHCGQRFY